MKVVPEYVQAVLANESNDRAGVNRSAGEFFKSAEHSVPPVVCPLLPRGAAFLVEVQGVV